MFGNIKSIQYLVDHTKSLHINQHWRWKKWTNFDQTWVFVWRSLWQSWFGFFCHQFIIRVKIVGSLLGPRHLLMRRRHQIQQSGHYPFKHVVSLPLQFQVTFLHLPVRLYPVLQHLCLLLVVQLLSTHKLLMLLLLDFQEGFHHIAGV